ncbi:hypothetical protein CDL15_Pgr005929 [Punica granatum]|uniref:Pentatricopeptide repeat-containing protein n=1 Tax=Punica granatum TaxID=22663 RepID=A0A218WHP2_PUNGR|nr:hypothetical protein CDL15_Pgr005929 [Punica granatum]
MLEHIHKNRPSRALDIFRGQLQLGFSGNVDEATAAVALKACNGTGLLVDARKVFDEMPTQYLVSWGAMISGYTQEGNYGSESIRLLIGMLREGEAQATEGVKLVFENMLERNVIPWTAMISADESEAVSIFNSMRWDGIFPNDVTFVGLLHSITRGNLVPKGQMVRGYCIRIGFTSELNVSNCLMTMYAKFEEMGSAKRVFEEAPSREIISWNALISGYAQNGMCQEALVMYFSAIMESYQPKPYTFGSVLSAIGSAESISLRQDQRCRYLIIKFGLDSDSIFWGSLLDMHAKRGSISESLSVFSQTSRRSQFAWTAIISAHARHGDNDSVVELFKEMEKGVKPDLITYLSVLTACGRKGMVDVGREVFKSMIRDRSIEPSHEHCSCMVDMLGRAGQLDEAEEILGRTPGG